MNKTKIKFRDLKVHEKFKLIKSKGLYVGSRIYNGTKILLFSIFGFFVELWLDLNLNKILNIGLITDEIVELIYVDKIALKM
ncbi:MAG: hypothetical protein MRY83_14140 [Flavobacteriales bacterium]|nr:hypothetical protein [Flavobacteriales bacterium]